MFASRFVSLRCKISLKITEQSFSKNNILKSCWPLNQRHSPKFVTGSSFRHISRFVTGFVTHFVVFVINADFRHERMNQICDKFNKVVSNLYVDRVFHFFNTLFVIHRFPSLFAIYEVTLLRNSNLSLNIKSILLGSILPNFLRQAKSCQHTALSKKSAVQFHQLCNFWISPNKQLCWISPNNYAEFRQICSPIAKYVCRLPNAICQ